MIIDSTHARRVVAEHDGEPLREILQGYADQAEVTGLTRRCLARTLGISYSGLTRWLSIYGIQYPRVLEEDHGDRVRSGMYRTGTVLRLITAQGRTMSAADWAERTGLPRGTVYARLQRGWPEDLAVTAPVGVRYRPPAGAANFRGRGGRWQEGRAAA